MRIKKLLYIFLIISLFGCHNDIPSHNVIITRCKDIPVGRAHAMAWSANGQGYILGGRDSVGVLHNDVWAYNLKSDTWKKIEDSPLTARVNGTACAVGEKIYLGLGFHQRPYQSSAYLQDWWEYTPLTNEWRRLQDFPNKNTVGAISYTQDNKIYCVHGSGVGFTADVIAYDIANNQWEIINRPHRNDRMGMAGTGTSLHNRHYYGTGFNTNNFKSWYEVELDGPWIRLADVPGEREMATCVATDKYLYLLGGRRFGGTLTTGRLYNDVLCFHTDKNQWHKVGTTSECAENRFAFTIDGVAYVGGGENDNTGVLNTLYRIED